MRKILAVAVCLICSGMFSQSSFAQQTSSATGSQSSASSPAKTPASPAKRSGTASKSAAPLALKTQKDKFSYSLGMRMGANLRQSLSKQSVPFDSAIMARAFRDAISGNKTLMTDEEAQATITAMQKEVQGKMQAKMKEEGDTNKKIGEDFLAANKSKDGVVTLPSGLQYKILTKGSGPKPTASDTVECNYRGTLINGKEFDSSSKHGGPASFPVGGVIKGWTEALQLMPVGSKWQLFIPPDLAYGERGAGGDIGPDETLIFEVELLSIKAKGDAGKEPEKK
ncbi:MAG TPA: FKBP-type peptidyl-prolyl cis-trans isomerase, partial [Candidatus Sulfotelmatobacter sp.]